jgi:hypothetical protein
MASQTQDQTPTQISKTVVEYQGTRFTVKAWDLWMSHHTSAHPDDQRYVRDVVSRAKGLAKGHPISHKHLMEAARARFVAQMNPLEV